MGEFGIDDEDWSKPLTQRIGQMTLYGDVAMRVQDHARRMGISERLAVVDLLLEHMKREGLVRRSEKLRDASSVKW